MQFKAKNNRIEYHDPPIPPPPHFDWIEVAAAQPVQPLSEIRWRRLKDLTRSIMRGHVSVVGAIFIAFVLSFGLTLGFMSWEYLSTPASAETTNTATQPATELTQNQKLLSDAEIGIARKIRAKHRSTARLRRVAPIMAFDDEEEAADYYQRPRPRFVRIVH